MNINNALSKLLGNNKSIDEVQIDPKVIDEIVKIAINADPKEFVALLSGKINKNILKITGLIFLPFEASDTSAVMQVFMMPITTNAVGSVHSHPGPSANPSNADLTFFGKNGYFHMIICRPYSEATIKSYDAFGNPVPFVVKDLGDEVEIKQWDDLDIDKEFLDEELLSELERVEKQDESSRRVITFTNNNNKSSSVSDNNEIKKNEKDVELLKPATINLQFEMNGKMIHKELPLPPDYEPGDEIEVDVRTDRTPNDDIDEIILNIKKSPENLAKIKNNHQIPTNKSSEEIDNEIKQLESDIAKLKQENERLKKNM